MKKKGVKCKREYRYGRCTKGTEDEREGMKERYVREGRLGCTVRTEGRQEGVN